MTPNSEGIEFKQRSFIENTDWRYQTVATKSKQHVTDVEAYCTEAITVSIQSPHPMCGVQIITDGVQESSHLLTA